MPPARLLMTAVFTASVEIALALRFAARIDQAGAAHVAVRDLVARQVDRMIAREIRVHLLVRLAEVDRVVAAVVLGQLLLDDVGLDRHAEVIRLAGEIGGDW